MTDRDQSGDMPEGFITLGILELQFRKLCRKAELNSGQEWRKLQQAVMQAATAKPGSICPCAAGHQRHGHQRQRRAAAGAALGVDL